MGASAGRDVSYWTGGMLLLLSNRSSHTSLLALPHLDLVTDDTDAALVTRVHLHHSVLKDPRSP